MSKYMTQMCCKWLGVSFLKVMRWLEWVEETGQSQLVSLYAFFSVFKFGAEKCYFGILWLRTQKPVGIHGSSLECGNA